jgi:hypothetical protein
MTDQAVMAEPSTSMPRTHVASDGQPRTGRPDVTGAPCTTSVVVLYQRDW